MTPTAEHPGLRLLPHSMGKSSGAAMATDPSGEAGSGSGFAGLIEALDHISVVTDPYETWESDSSPQSDDLQDGLPALPSTHEWLSLNQAASLQKSLDATGTAGETDVKDTGNSDETAETEGNATPGLNVSVIAMTAPMAGPAHGPEFDPAAEAKVTAGDSIRSDPDTLKAELPESLPKTVFAAPPANAAGPQIAAAATVATQASAALLDRKSKAARDATTQPATPDPVAPPAASALQAGPAFSAVQGVESRASVARRDMSGMEIRIDTKVTGAQIADVSTAVVDAVLPDKSQPALTQVQFIDSLPLRAQDDQSGLINSPQLSADPVVISTTDPNWEVEFVDSIVAQVTGEDAVIDLSLSPDNLGKVEVRVELRDGRADVTFVTETREAARLFAQAEGRLSDLMQRHGLDLGGQASSQRDSSPRQSGGQHAQAAADTDLAPLPRLAGEGRVNLVA